jgi:hypothetical protein
MNGSDGTFAAVDYRLSPFTTFGSKFFGSAFADYDNDCNMDLFVANHDNQGQTHQFILFNSLKRYIILLIG